MGECMVTWRIQQIENHFSTHFSDFIMVNGKCFHVFMFQHQVQIKCRHLLWYYSRWIGLNWQQVEFLKLFTSSLCKRVQHSDTDWVCFRSVIIAKILIRWNEGACNILTLSFSPTARFSAIISWGFVAPSLSILRWLLFKVMSIRLQFSFYKLRFDDEMNASNR